MWFRNLQIYRLPVGWDIELESFETQLARKRFVPCGSQDMESRGWVGPVSPDALVHAVGNQWLIALGVEGKLLPASVVRQVADERAADIEAEQGFKPGRKAMKELREAVTQELLPRAFTRRRKIYAWIDRQNGWLVVDAPSTNRAEEVIELLRDSLDHLPLELLRTEHSPASAMADWLAGGDAPHGFTIDQDCELRAVTDDKASVRYARHSLDNDEVRAHLAAGKSPTRLALTFDDRISFVLTEKLEIKRLSFLDVITEQLEAEGRDVRELFDASFALMTGELCEFFPALVLALGGEMRPRTVEAPAVTAPDWTSGQTEPAQDNDSPPW